MKIYLSITLRYPVSISTTFYVVTPRLLSLRWADHGCWQCWHARQGFYTPPTPSLWLQTLTHFVFFYTLHPRQLLVLVLVCRGSNNQVLCCGVWYYVPLEFTWIWNFWLKILSTETPPSSPPIFQSIYNSRPNALKQPPFHAPVSFSCEHWAAGSKILSIGHQNS